MSTWIYQVEQCLNLIQLGTMNRNIDVNTRVSFASTFFIGTLAVWWNTIVQGGTLPTTWLDFKQEVTQELIPDDHIRRAREKLLTLKQSSSVARYLSESRNISLTIPGMTDGEKWGQFCSGLKCEVRLEVLKSAVTQFEEAARI